MKKTKKDYSKYLFLGNLYGKGALVLAVIKDHAIKHPEVTVGKLQSMFPKSTMHTAFELVETVKDSTKGRFYLNLADRIKTKEAGKMVVTNQWGRDNINALHVKIRHQLAA